MDTGVDRSRDPLTLRFADRALERDFQAEMAAVNGPQARVGAVISAGLWLIGAFLIPIAIDIDRGLVVLICGGMVVANLAGAVGSRWAPTLDRQQVIGLTLNALAGLAVLALIEGSGTFDRYAAPALLLIAIFAFVVIRLRFVFALVAAGTYLIGFVVVLVTRPTGGSALDVFLVAAAILVGLGATYLLERSARDVFAQRRLIESQAAELAAAHATSERLLRNILPESVAQRLKDGETTIADGYDDATVLFADLVGFTPLAASLGPAETVGLLDRLFSAFDLLAERHGLEKIKTIGDAYMVVGGVPVAGADHPSGPWRWASTCSTRSATWPPRSAVRSTSGSGSTPGRWWPASSARASSSTTCGVTRSTSPAGSSRTGSPARSRRARRRGPVEEQPQELGAQTHVVLGRAHVEPGLAHQPGQPRTRCLGAAGPPRSHRRTTRRPGASATRCRSAP